MANEPIRLPRVSVKQMPIAQAFEVMCEEDFDAINILAALTESNPLAGPRLLLNLADMNIRGAQITCAFRTYANSDVEVLAAGVHARDPLLVTTVNRNMGNSPHRAVTSGGGGQIVS
jgi:hypothetical protein